MGEGQGHHHLLHQQPQRPQTHSRFGGPRVAGEIVEVQGGHIVRSTGRKDRHSKVCTAKGPRDRRVRLSAHTAIQFYDVQDRLGYERPSMAVDWLMKNAKAAIDELDELPAWHPSTAAAPSATNPPPLPHSHETPTADSGKKPMPAAEPPNSSPYGFLGSSSFLPPSLDSDAIADTIKSFFPMAASVTTATSSSPAVGYQNYPPDLLSRTSSQTQDLRLSLQSFNPNFHHHHQSTTASGHHALFSSPTHLAFDATTASWSEQNQRMLPWNVAETSSGGESGGGDGSGGFVFNMPPPQAVPLHPMLGHSQFFTQRGPLQSSNPPSVCGWADPIASRADHQMHPALHPTIPSIGFSSGSGFSGFRIPARIQGEEEHDGISDKPSSASSGSHH